MHRPALKQLLDDIERNQIDVIVVYKVDRLSRSLHDFARMMELFDRQQVSFVSVTQQFNTTTSMGRLTLNILLSFAQFEREVTGERIRDKIAASKQKGIWMGGVPPLGYQIRDRQLHILEDEANLVRYIYTGYLETGSLLDLANKLNDHGYRSKYWQTAAGKWSGGKPLTVSHLNQVLRNAIYIGKISHRNKVYEGQHPAIIDVDLWERVQSRFQGRSNRHSLKPAYLLQGKLRTHEGFLMSPSSARRKDTDGNGKTLFRYYVSRKALTQGYKTCPIKTVNASQLEDLVTAHIRNHLLTISVETEKIPDDLIDNVVIGPDELKITINRSVLETIKQQVELEGNHSISQSKNCFLHKVRVQELQDIVVLHVSIQFKRMKGIRTLVSQDGKDIDLPGQATPDEAIVAAIGRAYRWKQMLLNQPGMTLKTLARQCGYSDRYISRCLTLTGLAPDILHQALSIGLPKSVTLDQLEEAAAFLDWSRQKQILGLHLA